MTARNILLLFSLLCAFFACTERASEDDGNDGPGYVITGKIKNHDKRKKLKFYDSYAGDTAAEYVIDVKEDGSFRYVGSFETATPVLFVYGLSENGVFELNEKLIVFLADGDSINLQAESSNLSAAKITGGSEQRIFQNYNDLVREQVEALEQDLVKLNTEKNKDKLAEINLQYEANLKSFLATSRDYVSQHSNTIAGLYIALNALPIEENISIFEHLVVENKDKNSPWVQKLAKTVEKLKPVSIGAVVPDFFAYDSSGNKVHVKDFRGKYLLIDFWASWCVPCRKDHEIMNACYPELKEMNLEILGVSIDKERQKWIDALKSDKTTWKNIHAENESDMLMRKFQIQAIPHSILIDPEGVILAKNVRGLSLRGKLESFLNAKD